MRIVLYFNQACNEILPGKEEGLLIVRTVKSEKEFFAGFHRWNETN